MGCYCLIMIVYVYMSTKNFEAIKSGTGTWNGEWLGVHLKSTSLRVCKQAANCLKCQIQAGALIPRRSD